MKLMTRVWAVPLVLLLFLTAARLVGQAKKPLGYEPAYRLQRSGQWTMDKNFYLITVVEKTPSVLKLIKNDTTLSQVAKELNQKIKLHGSDTCTQAACLIGDFIWSSGDSTKLLQAIHRLYTAHSSELDGMIDHELRPSGNYQRFADLPNEAFLAKTWSQYIVGTRYILQQYGLGKKMRYPAIDSPNYAVSSRYYRTVLKDIFNSLQELIPEMGMFYQPSLQLSLQLMNVNDRDEPARFEPLTLHENKLAYDRVKTIQWDRYPYAAIIVPGNGPMLASTPISADNKIHCDLAARRYLQQLAPYIITSGGYCYPFRGPYCEAYEMKKYLMSRYGIPEQAIIMEPQARHTTTNIRNSHRLMIRYAIPQDKPSLFVTTKSQTDYAANPRFDERNIRELGYLPYRGKLRKSTHEIVFYPVIECLQIDPLDPLDP